MGLTVGAGIEKYSGQGKDADKENVTGYALYTMGPVSVGYQTYYLDQWSLQLVELAAGS